MSEKSYSYEQAGVSIAAGNALVKAIGPLVKATARPGADAEIGGFGGFFDPRAAGYTDPLLVAANDGVGTKVKLAIDHDRHDTIGQDLVAMCVNDLIVQGAEPLFFLDYFATGKLETGVAERVVASIAEGCKLSGCALIGGETAEMPGMYAAGDYDLAGFCVGAVERAALIEDSRVREGDLILGIDSSGPHSNGYSLIRRILAVSGADLAQDVGGVALADALMAPTRIYVKPILALLAQARVSGLAHITGGGLTENVIRVVPAALGIEIDPSRWTLPPVFRWLQEAGRVADAEMWRTFNCGIGFTVIAAPADLAAVRAVLDAQGLAHREIGRVMRAAGAERVRIG